MNDEVVTRLYRCLVEALRRRDHAEAEAVKVSDLYQELVPYREVRPALGVELKADYEHALLRLLAGERDLLTLEPEDARDELRREVEAPYPFVGLFRKFAECDVRVSMRHVPEASGPAPGQGAPARGGANEVPFRGGGEDGSPRPRMSEGGGGPLRPAGRSGGPIPARAQAPVQLHREGTPPDPTQRLTHAGSECVFCGEDLPTGRRVRFCPYCGGDLRLRPCPRCDAVLEREWHYCINCGHAVTGS